MTLSIDTQLAIAKMLNSALTRSKLSQLPAAERKLNKVRAQAMEEATAILATWAKPLTKLSEMASEANGAAKLASTVGVAAADVRLLLERGNALLDVLDLADTDARRAA